MLIARWQVDARFGQKQQVIDRLKSWATQIAPQVGLRTSRLLTGSIGTPEATVEHNWEVDSLADLEAAWAKLATMEAHRDWGRQLEPFVVSGSTRWSILRVL
jgi:hypothetical protein